MTNHLTPAEFAEAVSVDVGTVRRWLRAKHLKARRMGRRGHWQIPESELLRVLGQPAPATMPSAAAEQCYRDLMARLAAGG